MLYRSVQVIIPYQLCRCFKPRPHYLQNTLTAMFSASQQHALTRQCSRQARGGPGGNGSHVGMHS